MSLWGQVYVKLLEDLLPSLWSTYQQLLLRRRKVVSGNIARKEEKEIWCVLWTRYKTLGYFEVQVVNKTSLDSRAQSKPKQPHPSNKTRNQKSPFTFPYSCEFFIRTKKSTIAWPQQIWKSLPKERKRIRAMLPSLGLQQKENLSRRILLWKNCWRKIPANGTPNKSAW